MLKIENLSECQDLDVAATSELRGGYDYGYVANYLASYSTTNTNINFTQNAFSLGAVAGAGSVISIANFNPTIVSAGSPQTLVIGALS